MSISGILYSAPRTIVLIAPRTCWHARSSTARLAMRVQPRHLSLLSHGHATALAARMSMLPHDEETSRGHGIGAGNRISKRSRTHTPPRAFTHAPRTYAARADIPPMHRRVECA
ncbi:hypothetical protein FOMPIDRAFT_1051770 [Fomitopsis schrenkii]|uniref:Uncharacterized protein n=1 Tax=Fomitopsis schrenkii TaxID=2126942 RepID=S8FIJ7_FOMSC|nr:hypothetical protein FOMPIDRAFT_1051770 [Fomitopsis schrenkii]